MTLEEAIKHAEYIVNNRKYAISVCWSVKDCEQIAEWLKELAERRKLPEIIRCGECELKIECCRNIRSGGRKDDDFCSFGRRAERRTDDKTNKGSSC